MYLIIENRVTGRRVFTAAPARYGLNSHRLGEIVDGLLMVFRTSETGQVEQAHATQSMRGARWLLTWKPVSAAIEREAK